MINVDITVKSQAIEPFSECYQVNSITSILCNNINDVSFLNTYCN